MNDSAGSVLHVHDPRLLHSLGRYSVVAMTHAHAEKLIEVAEHLQPLVVGCLLALCLCLGDPSMSCLFCAGNDPSVQCSDPQPSRIRRVLEFLFKEFSKALHEAGLLE